MKAFATALFVSFTIVAQEEKRYDILCVSLGWNCQVAAKLRDNGLRRFSFPCDWNQTSYTGLCSLIKNRFQGLLNPDYLIYKDPKAAGIFNTKYNVALSHAFPTYVDNEGVRRVVENYIHFLPEVTNTYERRIARFYDVCSMADFVCFFRMGSNWHYDTKIDEDTVIELRDILLETFPTKNWLLVVIHNDETYTQDWGIPMVKNMYLETAHSHDEWKELLTQLDLAKKICSTKKVMIK